MSIEEKLTTIAENESKVYDAGYDQGVYDSGFNNGYNAGIDAEHKAFWNSYQNYGNRTNYRRAFGGECWTADNFKPIYDIQPTNAYYMFSGFCISGDLTTILGNVKLDLSKATYVGHCFGGTKFTQIGEVNTKSAKDLERLFYKSDSLQTIDKLILKDDGSQTFSTTFGGCTQLKNLNIEGVIGTTLSLSASPLSKASIESVIGAVSEAKAVKLTLNKSAVVSAFGSVTNAEWLALINTRPKCTVVLA